MDEPPRNASAGGTAVALAVILALVGHALYSRYGYNPTDEGMIIAMSRRVLEGEVIHRDFIFSRPIGSVLVGVPMVAFGGDWTYLLSRFWAWFCLSSVAVMWA